VKCISSIYIKELFAGLIVCTDKVNILKPKTSNLCATLNSINTHAYIKTILVKSAYKDKHIDKFKQLKRV